MRTGAERPRGCGVLPPPRAIAESTGSGLRDSARGADKARGPLWWEERVPELRGVRERALGWRRYLW